MAAFQVPKSTCKKKLKVAHWLSASPFGIVQWSGCVKRRIIIIFIIIIIIIVVVVVVLAPVSTGFGSFSSRSPRKPLLHVMSIINSCSFPRSTRAVCRCICRIGQRARLSKTLFILARYAVISWIFLCDCFFSLFFVDRYVYFYSLIRRS